MGKVIIFAIIVFVIAFFWGRHGKQQEATRRAERAAAWERNKWLEEEGEKRQRERINKWLEERREKNGAAINKWCEEQERRRQIYEDERIRQRAREGKGWWGR